MTNRISLFGLDIDVLDMAGAIDQIVEWLDCDGKCRYVVTPNVDHVVMLRKNAEFRSAYQDASLVLADGFPLIVASRWLGKPLPERVAGSELIPALFDRLEKRTAPTRVFLLGAMPGVAVKAARRIDRDWPHLKIAGTYSPPFGFEKDDAESESILARIEAANPDVVIFGVGAPKQELWAQRYQDRIQSRIMFCVGATIDFLAGEKAQAPVWMRRSGLEWLHRCATEPRRLAKRYAMGAIAFPQIVFREWVSGRAG